MKELLKFHKRKKLAEKSNQKIKIKHLILLTTQAKTTARAKAGPPVPCCRAIAATRAITVAECDDGIPPESSILFESHLFSLYLVIISQSPIKIHTTTISTITQILSQHDFRRNAFRSYGPGGEDLEELRDGAGEDCGEQREIRRQKRGWIRRRSGAGIRVGDRDNLVHFRSCLDLLQRRCPNESGFGVR